jgi:hypothetical protein
MHYDDHEILAIEGTWNMDETGYMPTPGETLVVRQRRLIIDLQNFASGSL